MAGTTFAFEAIGTHWQIRLVEEVTSSAFSYLEEKIKSRIALFDMHYSRFRDDSLIAEMAREAGVYKLPADGPALLFLYERVYEITKGKVTPLIGSVMVEAGYDKDYSLVPKELHIPPTWDEVLHFDGTNLILKQPSLLDVGAAGKGYLIDIIGRLLLDEGYTSFMIDAGGDVIHRSSEGEKARIGLEHPLDTRKVIGVVSLGNESICGSAGNRRRWGNFTHIIDPDTLTSPTEILATWVIADTTLLSDMLATCLFFVPPETLAPHFAFEYVIFRKNHSATYSNKLKLELF